ncbi:MAG: hypothetical protein NWS68_05810 [Erythrobacter sp.]|nr:hypothetical protein [Erythrobacter sp.]
MIDEPPPLPQLEPVGSEVVVLDVHLAGPPRHVCARYAVDPANPDRVICESFPVIEVPADDGATAANSGVGESDGRVVIDLTQYVPPPPAEECAGETPDPFNPEIVVCRDSGPSPRLGPVVGPADEGFGSAIPRARVKLSDTATAEANATAPSVGGWNAQGGEVRLKIDF